MQKMSPGFAILAVGASLFGLGGCKKEPPKTSLGPPTVVYLVRHAEKVLGGVKNPPLTRVGHLRALALARMLHSVPLHAVYSSQFKRTQQTVSPTANAKKLPVIVHKAHGIAKLVALIRRKHRGESVLISGHSNTVPAFLKAFGVPFAVKLAEKTAYDNLFVLVLRRGGPPVYLRYHFGPPPPKK